MHMGFRFKQWIHGKLIANGHSILEYINETCTPIIIICTTKQKGRSGIMWAWSSYHSNHISQNSIWLFQPGRSTAQGKLSTCRSDDVAIGLLWGMPTTSLLLLIIGKLVASSCCHTDTAECHVEARFTGEIRMLTIIILPLVEGPPSWCRPTLLLLSHHPVTADGNFHVEDATIIICIAALVFFCIILLTFVT